MPKFNYMYVPVSTPNMAVAKLPFLTPSTLLPGVTVNS